MSIWGILYTPASELLIFLKMTSIMLPIKRRVFLSLPLNCPANQRMGFLSSLPYTTCLRQDQAQGTQQTQDSRMDEWMNQWMNEWMNILLQFLAPEALLKHSNVPLALCILGLWNISSVFSNSHSNSMYYIYNKEINLCPEKKYSTS